MTDLPPLIPGQVELPEEGGDCGCCAGIEAATPLPLANRPGLPAISYRAGTWASFRESQLARLSADEHPALARLQSRENDDFTISLIDAWSCVCDVLTFYQERNAHEAWLGTATERGSLVELGRLIGYRLRPGVAAGSDLVFLMDDPPGASATVAAVEVPARTRVQSIPGPGEVAQTFETTDPIQARVAWNALTPRRSRFVVPVNGDRSLWLQGVATGLSVGDAIIIVGRERTEQDNGSERWDFRKLTRVLADPANNRTRIEWARALGSVDPPGLTAQKGHRLYALRTRASLFGWNAPHPKLLAQETRTRYGFGANSTADWPFSIDTEDGQLHLDAIQKGFVADSWVALTRPRDVVELYRITEAVDDGRADYAVSARVTRLTFDTNEHLAWFEDTYRRVSAYGESEELAFAETPDLSPVAGDEIELAASAEGLEKGHRLVVRGKRAQLRVLANGLQLTADDGSKRSLEVRQRLTLLTPPVPVTPGSATSIWRLRVEGGFEGTITAKSAAFEWVAADQTAETIAEVALLDTLDRTDDTHALLRLDQALIAAFDRMSTVVHANVAAATHGETTQEVMGSGNAGVPFQNFALKQSPLTHVSAGNETGFESSLEVRVDDVLWHEAPTLYGRRPADPQFETRIADDGTVTVQFGDGVTGARLPTGRNNIVATYRKGIGVAGSVAAGALATALDRPLGLRDVFNPLAAAGGQDPEKLDGARTNAPIGTLTLGRVVSLRNYEDFARGFGGIAKARADWVWDGEARRVAVTVAGPGGAVVDPSQGMVFANLVSALRAQGDPFVRIGLVSYRKALFRLKARILIDPDHLPEKVLTAVETALRAAYGFERRGFAEAVASSEIVATIHEVPGVAGVDLDRLHRVSGPGSSPTLHHRLLARPVALAADGALEAAEILTLDPAPLSLEVIQ